MLVLTRKENEVVRINDDIAITIVKIEHGKVKIGIEAPADVAVHRQEVYGAIQRDKGAER
jgi:carbon storage regulator